jgi:hypothetical protein
MDRRARTARTNFFLFMVISFQGLRALVLKPLRSHQRLGLGVRDGALNNESSKAHGRSSRGGRPFLFLIRGNGLRSRWQSRQSDRGEIEPSRRSSELRGALHSSQRGGPTRPLWSCAIEMPPSRTQTGEQMKTAIFVVKQAWFQAALLTILFGHTLGTSSFCGGVRTTGS